MIMSIVDIHQTSFTLKRGSCIINLPSMKYRLFCGLTKKALCCAFSQNGMTRGLTKEVHMTDWHIQSAPSAGGGDEQWPKTIKSSKSGSWQ